MSVDESIIRSWKSFYFRRSLKTLILILFSVLISCSPQQDNPSDDSAFSRTVSQTGAEQVQTLFDQADVSSIDAMLGALYDSISFAEGKPPNLNRLRSLFTPRASFLRIRQDGVDRMNLDSFLSSFQERIDSGALKSFYEAEIFRRTHSFGRIAQVFSAYKKRMNSDDPKVFTRGINSVQLYHDGQRWWIGSILWEDEDSDNPIPEEYVKELK